MGYLRPWLALLLVAATFAADHQHRVWRPQNKPRVKPPEAAMAIYRKAKKAKKSGDLSRAYILYAQAAALDPKDVTDAWARSLSLRTRALTEMEYMPLALDSEEPVARADLDPALLGSISLRELEEARQPLPPIKLQANDQALSFDLRGTTKELYEKVAPAYGLDVVFDSDFEPGKPVRLRIEEAGYRDALHILNAATATFVVPISEKLFLVAKENQQKRQELEHNMAVVVPIPETVSVQEAQELARSVQQVMEIKRLVVDSARRMVLIRDRVSRVRPAQAIFDQMLTGRPEVVIEVEFLEMNQNSSLRYGIEWPTSISIAFLGVPGLAGFLPLGGPILANLWGLTIGNAELVASMSRGSSRTLLRSSMRSVSGQAATFHVGDKYPVQVNAYLGDVPGEGTVYLPPPQINFEDLGVALKVTPYVHGEEDVTLEVEAEYKVLAGTALNGIPVISNRAFQGVLRLQSDEWAIMAGLMRTSEARAVTGLAGLSSIPYLGALFSVRSKEKDQGEVLLVLKPTIVRIPAGNAFAKELWTGTETSPVSPI